jgi:hypothetical protein
MAGARSRLKRAASTGGKVNTHTPASDWSLASVQLQIMTTRLLLPRLIGVSAYGVAGSLHGNPVAHAVFIASSQPATAQSDGAAQINVTSAVFIFIRSPSIDAIDRAYIGATPINHVCRPMRNAA